LSFEFHYRVLSGKIEDKNICGSETLIDRERQLALEMPTTRTAHANKERENTPTKQQQDKA
jgi:flagellar basal body rod protein FlgF